MSEFKEVVIGSTFDKTDSNVHYYTKYDDTGAFLYLGNYEDVINYKLSDGTVVYSKTLNRNFDPMIDFELVVEQFTPVPPNKPFGNTNYFKIFQMIFYKICNKCSLNAFKKNGDNYEKVGDFRSSEIVGSIINFSNRAEFDITNDGVLYYKFTLPDQNGGKRNRVNKTRQRSKKNKRRSQRRGHRRR